jgi:16S rRNA (guanine966-N2)-methyltransferase
MRIIAGKAGRLAIQVPKAVARPTTDFVRQAIFSVLAEKVEDAVVLDLFAGSGALGLEALSRGAAQCTFVEEHRQAEGVIRDNLAKSKLEGGRVVKSCVHQFLARDKGSYDLIFADPPYAKSLIDRDHLKEIFSKGHIVPLLRPGGYFIAECSVHYKPHPIQDWELGDRRNYGSSSVLFYVPTGSADPEIS